MNLDKWAQEVVDGVETIISSGRIQSEESKRDLRACAALLQADSSEKRGVTQSVQMDDENADVQDIVDDGEDSVPTFILNEVYLIRSDHPPFWEFAR